MAEIIGLCGRMGVGKDAAAALLSMVGFQRIAFADQVRVEAANSIRHRECPVEAKAYPYIAADLKAATVEEVWAKPTSERMRRILQWWGTEYRRSQDKDYWVRIVGRVAGPTVFTDVRFPNEVDLIRKRGGTIWRISRQTESYGIPGHASEKMADEVIADLTIYNNGTLLDLASSLRAALIDVKAVAA